MDAMLFRGFPLVQRNDRLVYLQERAPSGQSCCVSYADFADWRAQSKAFEGMAFVASNRPIASRDGDGRPEEPVPERLRRLTPTQAGRSGYEYPGSRLR